MSDDVPQRGASRTALGVAAIRALHQTLDGEPKILDDRIAAKLLGGDAHPQIAAHRERADEPADKALRVRVLLRSRYAEDRLSRAVERGVRQCIILGAGFDTFAYRQPAWAKALRIFEVDHRATQDEKRRRLATAGVSLPENLQFVDIDFELVSLREGLRQSTLDFSAPTFFSCLGVLVYLTQDAADAVFQLVATFPPGSEIVFTYRAAGSQNSVVADRARAAGEPWQSQFDPRALKDRLTALGFSEVSFLSGEEANRDYFKDRSDGLQAPQRTGIATAVVGA
ncbi:MAG TPA: SAM-dependent methyltransferase [Rhizomicrobium sp.]